MDRIHTVYAYKAFIDGKFVHNVSLLISNSRFVRVERSNHGRFGNYISVEPGKIVVPAFVDTHTHAIGRGLYLIRPHLDEARSLDEALEMVVEYSRDYSPSELVVFEGVDESKWPERRLPTRQELDRVVPRRPVILRRICGHIAVANSRALQMIPEDVEGVDRRGGLMVEEVPIHLNEYFPPENIELDEALRAVQREFHSLGIGTIHEFGNFRYFKAYERALRRGQLKMRVYFSFYQRDALALMKLGMESGFGNDFLKIGGIKLFADGSVGARTAAFFEPYTDEHSNFGKLLMDARQIAEVVRKAEEAGLQVFVHAIGDRAIEAAIDGIARGLLTKGNPLHHRIEHFEFPTKGQIERVAELDIRISMQPNFAAQWGTPNGMYFQRLGHERWFRNNPIAKLIEHGVKLAFGSDAMPPSPIFGIKAAIDHPIQPYRISLEDAIRLYTEAADHLSLIQDSGRITPGRFADLAILNEDPLEVVALMINGEMVFKKEVAE